MRGNTREHQTNTRRKIGFARSRGESTKFGPGENYLHQTNTRRKIGFARSTSEVRAKVRSWSGRKVGTPDKQFCFHTRRKSFVLAPDDRKFCFLTRRKSFVLVPDEKVLLWHQTRKFCFGTRQKSSGVKSKLWLGLGSAGQHGQFGRKHQTIRENTRQTPNDTKRYQANTRRKFVHQTNTRRKFEHQTNTRQKSFVFAPDKGKFWFGTRQKSFALAPDEKKFCFYTRQKSFVLAPDEKVLFFLQTKQQRHLLSRKQNF